MNDKAESTCPRCAQALVKRSYGKISIDTCENCNGMFLDRGELDAIAAPHDGDLEFSTLDQESFEHADTHGVGRCPVDGGSMKKVEFNIYSGIILDYCPGCRGFWLDGKEMERIDDEIRALDEEATESVAPGMLWFAQFIWNLPR